MGTDGVDWAGTVLPGRRSSAAGFSPCCGTWLPAWPDVAMTDTAAVALVTLVDFSLPASYCGAPCTSGRGYRALSGTQSANRVVVSGWTLPRRHGRRLGMDVGAGRGRKAFPSVEEAEEEKVL